MRDFQAVSSERRAGAVGRTGNVLNTEANKMEAKQAEQLRNAYAGLANLRGPVADAINQATEEYANARTAAEKTAAKRNAVERVRAALSQTLGAEKKRWMEELETALARQGTRGTEAAGSAPEVKPEVMPSAAGKRKRNPPARKPLRRGRATQEARSVQRANAAKRKATRHRQGQAAPRSDADRSETSERGTCRKWSICQRGRGFDWTYRPETWLGPTLFLTSMS